VIEDEIVPEFYARDGRDLPTRWLARVRASMSTLAPRFSANRMVREYAELAYAPAAARFRERARDHNRLARELLGWAEAIERERSSVSFGALDVHAERDGYHFAVSVDFGSLDPCAVRVELYADPSAIEPALRVPMKVADTDGGRVVYGASITTTRPSSHFTPRIVPFHPHACVPAEAARICWQR
jgi:starch phosphorylase